MSIIFNHLRENEPISRAKISRDLKISAPAVSRVIDKLIKDGYITETEKVKTSSGKRPTHLKINKDKGYVIGIDLGKEKLKIAMTNFKGEMIKNNQGFKILNNKEVGRKIIEEIKKVISKYSQENKKNSVDIKAICIGVPADVDTDTGKIISASLYENWKDLNLKEILKNEFNIPIYIENDVNLSALGERKYGEGKKFKDIIFVEISKGIGAGIIIDNHLIRGSYGSAGELGFTIINVENLCFKTNNKGFLERFASVESIKNKAIGEIRKGKKTMVRDMVNNDLKRVEPSTVCEAAIRGDELSNNIIKEVVEFLSIGIINLILIINPQLIVIGGDICNLNNNAKKLFIEPIKKIVRDSIPFRIPRINLSSLGEDACVIGASFSAIESLLIGEFPYKIDQEVLS